MFQPEAFPRLPMLGNVYATPFSTATRGIRIYGDATWGPITKTGTATVTVTGAPTRAKLLMVLKVTAVASGVVSWSWSLDDGDNFTVGGTFTASAGSDAVSLGYGCTVQWGAGSYVQNQTWSFKSLYPIGTKGCKVQIGVRALAWVACVNEYTDASATYLLCPPDDANPDTTGAAIPPNMHYTFVPTGEILLFNGSSQNNIMYVAVVG